MDWVGGAEDGGGEAYAAEEWVEEPGRLFPEDEEELDEEEDEFYEAVEAEGADGFAGEFDEEFTREERDGDTLPPYGEPPLRPNALRGPLVRLLRAEYIHGDSEGNTAKTRCQARPLTATNNPYLPRPRAATCALGRSPRLSVIG